MSPIPLPALAVKPPQQQDLMGDYANLMRLKSMQQQQELEPLREQAMQQQVQSGRVGLQDAQLQLQQHEQAMKDAQTLRSLSPQFLAKGADGKVGYDYSGLFNAAAANGVSPQTLSTLQKSISDAASAKAGATKAQLANEQTVNNEAFQHLEGLRATKDPAQRQQLWDSARQWAAQNAGILKINPAMLPAQAPDDNGLSSIEAALGMHAQQLDDAARIAQINATNAKTDQAKQNMSFGPTGPAADSKYRFILSKLAARQPVSPQDMDWARGYEASKGKTTSSSDDLGIKTVSHSGIGGIAAVERGAPGRASASATPLPSAPSATPQTKVTQRFPDADPVAVSAFKRLNPTGKEMVRAIDDYSLPSYAVGRLMSTHPAILAVVHGLDPSWSHMNYEARQNMIKSYTSGAESKSINAIGTALGHANELRNAIDALGNGDHGINALRAIGQKIGVQVGDDPVTAFNLIVHRVAPEITQAYVQGGGGEGERAANAEDFNPSMSRQQLLKNWAKTVKLLFSKSAQQKQQWDTTMQPTRPENQFYTRFFSPVAREAIQRWEKETGQTSAIGATPPPGATMKVPGSDGKMHWSDGKRDLGVVQ